MLKWKQEGLFEPFVIEECENIKIALKQIAIHEHINPDALDFDLQGVSVYQKYVYEDVFEKIHDDEKEEFLSNMENLLEPNLLIRQKYTIRIKPKIKHNNRFYVKIDKICSEAFVHFKPGFILRNDDDFEYIYEELQKIKAWAKLLFFQLEAEKKALKEFLKALSYPLRKEERYLFMRGFNLIPTIEAKLEFKYNTQSKIQMVNKDDLLCVYYKPSLGRPGRNIRGKYIVPKQPYGAYDRNFVRYDEGSVRLKDYPDRINYYAGVDGIVKYENQYLQVWDSYEANEVSFKSLGNNFIHTSSDAFSIHITEQDKLKDAIGEGVRVQAAIVHVRGNVGARAEIKAREVQVGGFTHQDSKIFAKSIKIQNHKGYARGDVIKVKTLQSGTIWGRIVEIFELYGGRVYADEIHINTIHAYGHLHATKLIEVYTMRKGENKFFFACNLSPMQKDRFDALTKAKNTNLLEAIQSTKRLKIQNIEIKRLKKAADETRASLIAYKNKNQMPPAVLLEKFEKYHQLVLNLKEQKRKINNLTKEFEQARDELMAMDRATKSAKVIVHGGWVGYNEIRYCFFNPKLEVIAFPKEEDGQQAQLQDGQIAFCALAKPSGFAL